MTMRVYCILNLKYQTSQELHGHSMLPFFRQVTLFSSIAEAGLSATRNIAKIGLRLSI